LGCRSHAFLQRRCTAIISGFDESNSLIGYFVFPSFEILECICAGENAALSLVIDFVPGISEVVMGSRQSVVEYILDTFGVVAIDVLILCKLEFISVFIADLLL